MSQPPSEDSPAPVQISFLCGHTTVELELSPDMLIRGSHFILDQEVHATHEFCRACLSGDPKQVGHCYVCGKEIRWGDRCTKVSGTLRCLIKGCNDVPHLTGMWNGQRFIPGTWPDGRTP